MIQHIIKRKGHAEPFDERKLYASCFAACLNAHLPKEEAERLSGEISNDIKAWISLLPEVSSDEIFQKTVEFLKTRNPEVSFMYETHRDIS